MTVYLTESVRVLAAVGTLIRTSVMARFSVHRAERLIDGSRYIGDEA